METNEQLFDNGRLLEEIPLTDGADRDASQTITDYFKFIGSPVDGIPPRPASLPDDVARAYDIMDISNHNYLVRYGGLGITKEGELVTPGEDGFVPYEIPEGVRKWMLENKPTKR